MKQGKKNPLKNSGQNKTQPNASKQKSGVRLESTPVTEKVKPGAGRSLRNEGTNVSYEEEI